MARDQANGIDVFDDPTPRPTPGPPAHSPPLQRPVLPEPDWRAEEAAAARRHAEPDPEPPPPESLTRYPAKRRRKPVPTPRLDRIRAMLRQDGR